MKTIIKECDEVIKEKDLARALLKDFIEWEKERNDKNKQENI